MSRSPVPLERLVAEVPGLRPVAGAAVAVSVSGVCLDSRRVAAGDLYAALPGQRAHGLDFLEQARAAGASAVLTDAASAARVDDATIPVVVADDPRAVLGAVSAEVYDHPASRLRMIGITGTQGKTTTTWLAERALSAAGVRVGSIGTLGTRICGEPVASSLTTPEAPDLHRLLARMVDEGVETCVMEVSSHALVLGRVDGVVYDVGVFLNIGGDHLDFHGTPEAYFEAKARLLAADRSRHGLVCVDDADTGEAMAAAARVPVHRFSSDPDAATDWRVDDVTLDASGSTFSLHGPGVDPARVSCPMPGRFNVANAVAAVAACAEAGHDLRTVSGAMAYVPGVPGRMERVVVGQPFALVVDYAHKPRAVQSVLAELRQVTPGRLVTVIGAGGERDRIKRPEMARLAAEVSDLVVITDDNPRREDPAAIRAEMLAGVPADASARVREIGDRREAIAWAVSEAEAGDTVVIAGKGHETGQEIDGVVHPFDDRSVAAELMTQRLATSGGLR